MKYRIVHETTYHYSEPASLSQNELFLKLRNTETQQLLRYDLDVDPQPQYESQRTDFFGNVVESFMVQHTHQNLIMRSTSQIETAPQAPLDKVNTLSWEEVAHRLATRDTPEELDACQFVFNSPLVRISNETLKYIRPSFPPDVSILEGAIDLTRRIYTEFSYDKSATTVDTPVEQVLQNRKGVCQDFAHLAISCLRSIGLAARYVSGYLETLPPPGKPKLVGADASHAWFSLYIPGRGWVDFDPTNNVLCGERHITIAWGRDYGDVTPVKGVVMGGGLHTLSVSVDVAAMT